MDAATVLPTEPLERWSRRDIYDTLKAMAQVSRRNLAASVLERRQKAASGATIDGRAKVLNSAERLTALRAQQAAKERELAEKAAVRATVEAKKAMPCMVANCGKKFATKKGLKIHGERAHGPNVAISTTPSETLGGPN